jgi:hypothetical protein
MSFVLATNNYLKRHENHINELVAKDYLSTLFWILKKNTKNPFLK